MFLQVNNAVVDGTTIDPRAPKAESWAKFWAKTLENFVQSFLKLQNPEPSGNKNYFLKKYWVQLLKYISMTWYQSDNPPDISHATSICNMFGWLTTALNHAQLMQASPRNQARWARKNWGFAGEPSWGDAAWGPQVIAKAPLVLLGTPTPSILPSCVAPSRRALCLVQPYRRRGRASLLMHVAATIALATPNVDTT